MLNGDDLPTRSPAPVRLRLRLAARTPMANPPEPPVTFSLAQGRNIVNQWTWVDLSSLGSCVKTLGLGFYTTEYNEFGPTTPTYVAMDDLAVAATTPVLSWSGSGTTANWSASGSWGGATVNGSQALSFSGSSGRSAGERPADRHLNLRIAIRVWAAGFTLSGNRISLAGNITNLSSQTQAVNLDLRLTSDVTSVAALGGDLDDRGQSHGQRSIAQGRFRIVCCFPARMIIPVGRLLRRARCDLLNSDILALRATLDHRGQMASDPRSLVASVCRRSPFRKVATAPVPEPAPGDCWRLGEYVLLSCASLRRRDVRIDYLECGRFIAAFAFSTTPGCGLCR